MTGSDVRLGKHPLTPLSTEEMVLSEASHAHNNGSDEEHDVWLGVGATAARYEL